VGLESDQRQQIIYLGSVPHGGILYIRIHNLLWLVTVQGWQTGDPRYNWTKLDQVLDFLLANRLKPFFEIMGIPQGLEIPAGAREPVLPSADWRRLVRDLARHLIDRYGRDEVRSWYFEVWNEPDNWGTEALCKYYDACSAGLQDADRMLKWGGPGTWNTLFPPFKACWPIASRVSTT